MRLHPLDPTNRHMSFVRFLLDSRVWYGIIVVSKETTNKHKFTGPTSMPTLMTDQMTCSECHDAKPRSQFSVVDSVCLECFQQNFTFCDECGEILRKANSSRYTCQRGYTAPEGATLCGRCHDLHNHGGRPYYWRPTPLGVAIATYTRIGSKIKFGVEIETDTCSAYERLYKETSFGAKDDCTVGGMEFDSPILYGDEGLDCIEEITDFAEEHRWVAGRSCGLHTHYDMRDMSDDQLTSIAYAYRSTQSFWKAIVESHRHNASYCSECNWSCADFRRVASSYDQFADIMRRVRFDRYELVNYTAYHDHKTFEVRMLEGTLDAELICNWIILNCRFIDCVKDMTLDEIDDMFGRGTYPNRRQAAFAALTELLDDADLMAWVLERNAKVDSSHPLAPSEETA